MNEPLTVEQLDELQAAVGIAACIIEIPEKHRTATQKVELQSARELLSTNAKTLFETLTNDAYKEIRGYAENTLGTFVEYEDTLNDKATQPPQIYGEMSLELINEAITQCFQAQTTIYGCLEILVPKLDRWTEQRKRAKNILKGLLLSDSEWKAEAVYAVFEPIEVVQQFTNLTECVSAMTARKRTLDQAYNTLSRLLTLKQGSPASPISRRPGSSQSRY